MRSVWDLILAALVVGWLGGATAAAQGSSYREVVKEALAEFNAGNWAESIALFERAHGLRPSARTHRGLGLAYFENRQYVKALSSLRASLADKRRALTRAQRSHVEKIMARAEGFVGRFELALQPADATLVVDGYPAVLDSAGVLLLDPGVHEVVMSCDGCRTERVRLTVEPGRGGELRFDLQEPQQDQAEPGATAPLEGGESPQPSPPDVAAELQSDAPGEPVGPWALVIGGGALLAASIVTGALNADRYGELEDKCGDPCDPSLEGTRDEGEALQVATNVLLVGGLALALSGGLWRLLGGTGTDEPAQAGAACHGQGCSAHLRLRF